MPSTISSPEEPVIRYSSAIAYPSRMKRPCSAPPPANEKHELGERWRRIGVRLTRLLISLAHGIVPPQRLRLAASAGQPAAPDVSQVWSATHTSRDSVTPAGKEDAKFSRSPGAHVARYCPRSSSLGAS